MDAHPTDQTLSSYGLGKLDEASAESVNQHLEGCLDCRRRVAEMSSDSFLDRVRDARKGAGQAETAARPGDKGRKATILPPVDTFEPGLSEHPDYEIKKELGRGGMGVVYMAHNTLLGRDEVLKVIGRQVIERPGVLDRFLREMRAVAKLRHPNIVTAYSAVRLGESIVFAMEYVEGLDLSKLVKAKGRLPVGHACNFAYQAALGLQHAHEEGLVHRDIKPANLMLSRKGAKATVKVLDFGLAKVVREEKVNGGLTSEGQALGTPDFIAPEQILDAPSADIRADIYSLGGTLYYLLTGRPPFKANSLYDIYQAHISRDADPLNLVRPEVPTELAALVAKMMAKDPARRFQTPGEVAEALKPFFKTSHAGSRSSRPDVSQDGPTNAGRRLVVTASEPTLPATDAGGMAARVKKPAESSVAESRWESLIDLGQEEETSADTLETDRGQRPPRKRWPVALAAGLFGLILLGVIVITFRDREGRETGKLVLPEGSTATIEASPRDVAIVPRKENGAAPATAAARPDEVKPIEPGKTPPAQDGETPGDRAILARLSKPIPMKYPRETPLEDVLNDIRKATAGPDGAVIPIYVDPVGLQEAEKTMTSPITIDLEGVPLETTLRLVLRSLGMDYCVKDGVLYIADWGTVPEVRGNRPRIISDGSPESAAVMAKLDATIPMRFPNETPLEDVRKYIIDATRGPRGAGIPIYVDPIGLQEAEKTMTSPMTIDLGGVPLRTTLQLMLNQLGMTYYVEKGVLKITSAGEESIPAWVIKLAEKNKPDPRRFDPLIATVAPGLKLSARAIGLWDSSWPSLREHFGHPNVLRTHPVSQDVPFVMSTPVAVPAGQKTTLFLEVSHLPECDWNLVVKVNNRTLHDSIIGPETTREGWATKDLDLSEFAGKTVNLELLNKANGWDGESAVWGRIEIRSDAIMSGGGVRPAEAVMVAGGSGGSPAAVVLAGNWKVEGEELVQTETRTSGIYPSGSECEILLSKQPMSHYDLKFKALVEDGNQRFAAIFHRTDRSNLCSLSVNHKSTARATNILGYMYQDKSGFQSGMSKPFQLQRGHWYEVLLKVRGSQVKCDLDGQEWFRCVDERFTTGRVGLSTDSSAVRFREISLTTPEGKPISQGPPKLPEPTARTPLIVRGIWELDGNELVGRGDSGTCMLLLGTASLSAYDLKFKVKLVGGRRRVYAFFHEQSGGAGGCFQIGKDNGKDCSLYFMQKEGKDPKSTDVPNPVVLNHWYDVRVKVRGPEVWCYLDSEQLFYRKNSPVTEGRVGIGAWWSQARFRDISVTTPDGKDLWKGLPHLPR